MEWTRGEYRINDDKELLDPKMLHAILSHTYWAETRPLTAVEESIRHSYCFGLYCGNELCGFARVVTDHAVFSWLCDVVVCEDHRGKGLGKWLVGCVLEHPAVQGTRMFLATRDAHGLYEKYGFTRRECMVKLPG